MSISSAIASEDAERRATNTTLQVCPAYASHRGRNRPPRPRLMPESGLERGAVDHKNCIRGRWRTWGQLCFASVATRCSFDGSGRGLIFSATELLSARGLHAADGIEPVGTAGWPPCPPASKRPPSIPIPGGGDYSDYVIDGGPLMRRRRALPDMGVSDQDFSP